MTPEDQDLILALCITPHRREPMEGGAFLAAFGATDGVALGLELLNDAIARKDADEVELSLIVSFRFGFSPAHLPVLIGLAFADWHQQHEDVASAIGALRAPDSVPALAHLAWWVPDYLDFDDARALAVKTIWALASIEGDAPNRALEALAGSPHEVVAKCAADRLSERRQLRGTD